MTEPVDLDTIKARIAAATIPDFTDYEVHSDGTVWSMTNWRGYGKRRLRPVLGKSDYLKVRLVSPDGRRVNRAVHRLVAGAFLGERPDGCEIRHLNGDKHDNRAANLAWGTAKENAKDRDRHGRTARGSRNGFAVLTEVDVRAIRRMICDGSAQRDVAATFGVSPRAVKHILDGETWRHVA